MSNAAAGKPARLERSAELGILVLGFNRPYHLQSVLESLRQQGRLSSTHVWIDGTGGRAEFGVANEASVEIGRRYQVQELRAHCTHLGIEKLMIDALRALTQLYDRILILEDDCFPVQGAVDAFEGALSGIADKPEIYSVYGHHFGCEDQHSSDFSRFQGWGWAAHSARIRSLLPELSWLFGLNEQDYCAEIASRLTDAIRARLDVTPGRNVLKVLERGFSWDSATAFLTAERGMFHRRTQEHVVHCTGIVSGIGHFNRDIQFFRDPPFQMITLDEAWARFDRTSDPCDFKRKSYGLEQLDLKLIDALDPETTGIFIEIGGSDGLQQSNSVLLEKLGWSGILIEPNPASYARCVKTRPNIKVAHAACVSADFEKSHVTLTDVGLMSLTSQSAFDEDQREEWLSRGERTGGRSRQLIEVPAVPISVLLDRYGIKDVDLLLLDVEGAEIDVLQGLDFSKHAPRYILAEDDFSEDIAEFLKDKGYVKVATLSDRRYTRDCLYLLGSEPAQHPKSSRI